MEKFGCFQIIFYTQKLINAFRCYKMFCCSSAISIFVWNGRSQVEKLHFSRTNMKFKFFWICPHFKNNIIPPKRAFDHWKGSDFHCLFTVYLQLLTMLVNWYLPTRVFHRQTILYHIKKEKKGKILRICRWRKFIPRCLRWYFWEIYTEILNLLLARRSFIKNDNWIFYWKYPRQGLVLLIIKGNFVIV